MLCQAIPGAYDGEIKLYRLRYVYTVTGRRHSLNLYASQVRRCCVRRGYLFSRRRAVLHGAAKTIPTRDKLYSERPAQPAQQSRLSDRCVWRVFV